MGDSIQELKKDENFIDYLTNVISKYTDTKNDFCLSASLFLISTSINNTYVENKKGKVFINPFFMHIGNPATGKTTTLNFVKNITMKVESKLQKTNDKNPKIIVPTDWSVEGLINWFKGDNGLDSPRGAMIYDEASKLLKLMKDEEQYILETLLSLYDGNINSKITRSHGHESLNGVNVSFIGSSTKKFLRLIDIRIKEAGSLRRFLFTYNFEYTSIISKDFFELTNPYQDVNEKEEQINYIAEYIYSLWNISKKIKYVIPTELHNVLIDEIYNKEIKDKIDTSVNSGKDDEIIEYISSERYQILQLACLHAVGRLMKGQLLNSSLGENRFVVRLDFEDIDWSKNITQKYFNNFDYIYTLYNTIGKNGTATYQDYESSYKAIVNVIKLSPDGIATAIEIFKALNWLAKGKNSMSGLTHTKHMEIFSSAITLKFIRRLTYSEAENLTKETCARHNIDFNYRTRIVHIYKVLE